MKTDKREFVKEEIVQVFHDAGEYPGIDVSRIRKLLSKASGRRTGLVKP